MSPLRAALALLGIITAWPGSPRPAGSSEAVEVRPPTVRPLPGPAIPRPFSETVEQLDTMTRFALAQAGGVPARSHYCTPTDLGVSPLPPPRRLSR